MHTVNLETAVRQDLWEVVKGTYEAANYRHSVVDAMHHLTDILRAKSNLDGDGVELVSGALSGRSPILKVNKLETETERKTQEGIAHILRGLYLGVRNPRSHEQWVDSQETADAIIHFVSYLLDIIDKSEEPFTIPRFLTSVFDPYFVDSPQYADGLVNEIPANKRLDTLIEVFRARQTNPASARAVSHSILSRLNEEELSRFASIVSQELRSTQNKVEIRTALAILPGDFWPRINELARRRIETLLLASIRIGALNDSGKCSEDGSLGTWANSFLVYFTAESKEKARAILLEKLSWPDNPSERCYAVKYFMSPLPHIITDSSEVECCTVGIAGAINDGDTQMAAELNQNLNDLPESWRKGLAQYIKPERMWYCWSITPDANNVPLLSSSNNSEIPF
jgi:uncharacterized protein (TIGR02391 family)